MASEYDGIVKLAYMIVTQCCEDYREAYIKGKANELLKCKSFLLSGRVEIFTLFNFYGKDILKQMDADLLAKYGSFEERRKKKSNDYKVKIEYKKQQLEDTRKEIKVLLSDTTLAKEERDRLLVALRNRRYRLIGEINKLKKEVKD